MKKWMALLLACLLCLCAVGAMAEEPVTLSLNGQNAIDIYPDGYKEKGKDFVPYTGPYIITGTSKDVDTCLDFYSLPHQSTDTDAEPVVYTVTFQSVQIQSNSYCTALRFGNGEGENGKDITLNLINGESSEIEVCGNHPVFSNAGQKNVTVNLHNANGASLTYYSRNSGINDLYNNNVTLKIESVTVTEANLDDYRELVNSLTDKWKIVKAGTLQYFVRTEPTCTDEGQQAHWKCSGCEMLFEDSSGSMVTTSQALTLPAQHDLTYVEYKAPTCTENGNIEYYICKRDGCGRLFSDEDGTQELTADDVCILAAHNLEKVPAKDPTDKQEGSIEHYRCTKCSKLFSDANGTKALTADEVILPMLVRTDDLPQTGDSSHLLGWAALLGACCAGLWRLRRRG